MVIFSQFLSKNTVFSNNKLSKMPIVWPMLAHWHSNQEWRYIRTDTVGLPLQSRDAVASLEQVPVL